MKWVNTKEKNAEKDGYVVVSWYDTKEEVDHVVNQIHGCGARAFKAHHKEKNSAIEYDFWVLWVKKEDMYMLRPDYVKPEKPVRIIPRRNGLRKEQAIQIVRMRDEQHMKWEEIAEIMGKKPDTTMQYYYRYKRGELSDWIEEHVAAY